VTPPQLDHPGRCKILPESKKHPDKPVTENKLNLKADKNTTAVITFIANNNILHYRYKILLHYYFKSVILLRYII
jgi:hypothetical protein